MFSRKPAGVVFAMGDFNIGARNSELNDWRSENHEGDSCQCHGTHVPSGKKIDFIWFTRGTSRCTGRNADTYIHNILIDDDGSDHAIYPRLSRLQYLSRRGPWRRKLLLV